MRDLCREICPTEHHAGRTILALRASTDAASSTIRSMSSVADGRSFTRSTPSPAHMTRGREIVGLGGEIALLRVGLLGLKLLLLAVPALIEIISQRAARILRRPGRAADDVEHPVLCRLITARADHGGTHGLVPQQLPVAVKRCPSTRLTRPGSAPPPDHGRRRCRRRRPPGSSRDVDHAGTNHRAARRSRVTAGVAALGDDHVNAEADGLLRLRQRLHLADRLGPGALDCARRVRGSPNDSMTAPASIERARSASGLASSAQVMKPTPTQALPAARSSRETVAASASPSRSGRGRPRW